MITCISFLSLFLVKRKKRSSCSFSSGTINSDVDLYLLLPSDLSLARVFKIIPFYQILKIFIVRIAHFHLVACKS